MPTRKKADPALKLPKLELVEWVDSTSPGNIWTDHEMATANAVAVCYTVGFVVKETRREITLAGSYSQNQSGGVMTIPKAAIQRRARLKI